MAETNATPPGGPQPFDAASRLAPFWVRAAAWAVDLVVLSPLIAANVLIFNATGNLFLLLPLLVPTLCYKPFMEWRYGLCRICVVDGRGNRMDLFQSFVRSSPLILFWGPPYLYALNPGNIDVRSWMGLVGAAIGLDYGLGASRGRRTIHDLLTSTHCVWQSP